MSRVLDWPAAAAAGPAQAGGKGWQLGLLAGMGLPVPAGFVIPADASLGYRAGEALPASWVEALAQALARRGWSEQPLAVRSSATQEDSAQASFAGIHRSCLNVRGLAALVQAVRAVWDSRDSAAAQAYRQRLGLGEAAGMAVVVMPLLPAVAAGIAFTVDPLTGRDDQRVIHANWGLGESLVGGQAEGDTYRLAARHPDGALALVERRRGDKRKTSQLVDAGGTELADTPPERRTAWVLSDEQALALGTLADEVASALDYADPACDIEWVWDGATFWIVQARPVTARPRYSYPELAGQPLLWSRGNSRDVVPDPFAPLEWSLSRPLLERILTRSCAAGGYPMLPGLRRIALRRGRLYFETALMQWEAYDGFGVAPAAYNRMMGGQQPAIVVPTARLVQRLGWFWRGLRFARRSAWPRWRAAALFAQAHRQAAVRRAQALPDDNAALAAGLRAQLAFVCRADRLLLLQAAGSAMFVLMDLLAKHAPDEGPALAAALLAGGTPSVTAAQGYALMALAHIAAADHEALAWLRNPQRRGREWAQRLPAHSPFRRAFADFLERYGHRAVYESYLRQPRWREAPDYLFDSVLGLIGSDEAALRERQAQTAARARARLRQILPLGPRLLATLLIRIALGERNMREGARSALTAHAEQLRRQVLALGERLLATPDDVFQLSLPELYALVEGRLSVAAAESRVAWRRRQGEAYAAQADPELVIEHGAAVAASVPPSPVDADGWHGVAVGAGRASGPACIARHPDDTLSMATGAVLVAPSTDPSWTPAFLRAGALVMETGGFLSHGAIVAREFGLPAIANLPGILDRLEPGEWLQVDGERGMLRRVTAPVKASR